VRGVRFDMVKIEGATYQKPNYFGDSMNCSHYHVPKPVKYANSMNGYSTIMLSSYYIGKYEVTQDLYQAVLGKESNNSYYPYNYNSNARSWKMVKDEGPFLRYPVDCVTWKEAQRFVDSLNAITGLRFRLPTEAEWEYAASGGEFDYKYSGSNDYTEVAWGWDNGMARSHVVGLLQPNKFGLYDMSGNVREWCSDWFSPYYYKPNATYKNPKGPSKGTLKILKGGSWGSEIERTLEYFARAGCDTSLVAKDMGFRIVLDGNSSLNKTDF
jgi:formylglycine-generating enzyme required for sulfatase activity